jgi:kinesin family protein 4/21/27
MLPNRKFSSSARLDEESAGDSPPASPPTFRRQGSRDETGKNVFSRLVAGTNIGEAAKPGKGVINPYQGRLAPRAPMMCTGVAEGHNKAVLSVCATEDLLFSASKDRTVKVRCISVYGHR